MNKQATLEVALVVSKQKYPESNIMTLEHYKAIKQNNPKTPEINVTLLKFMEEYEHGKYLLMRGQYDKYYSAG